MKNKILLVIMLLLTFFGLAFSGLSSVEVKATTDTVSYDINAINVPRNVISSFPVTYKSVHGNTITWAVDEGQNIISYDEEAHWMVINRPESGTNSVVFISVTVTDGVNTQTKGFEIIVPAGKTAAPKYTITYTNGNDVTTDTYKLGDPTKVLQAPSAREGYTFDGWYEGETKVEKILVGSARNYNLEARWTKNATPLSEVSGSLEESESEYNNTVVTPVLALEYEGQALVQGTHYTVSYTKGGEAVSEIKNAGSYKVVVTAKAGSGYTGTKEFDYVVTKATYDMRGVTFEDATHVYNGEERTLVIGGELPEGVEVSYTTNTLTHVGSVEVTATFTGDSENYEAISSMTKTLTITPATYTLTPGSKQIFVGNSLPSWNVNEFEAIGRIGNDVINVNSEDLVIEYKNENGEPVVQPSAAGTYRVVVKGLTIDNNDYSLVVNEGALTIIATNFTVSVPEGPYVYNGEAHTPTVTVKDGNTLLEEGTHYEVAYSNNTNAGLATVTLTAKGVYAGLPMPTAEFTISPKEITLTAKNVSYTYGDTPVANGYVEELSEADEEALAPQVSIENGKTVVSYTANSNYNVTTVDGTVTMNARAITVTANDATSVYGSQLATLTYTVEGYTVNESDLAELGISLTKAEGTDAGTYTITVTATSNEKFVVTTVNGTYEITKLDLSNSALVEVLGEDFNVQCNNTPSIRVKYNGAYLDAANYTVSYEDNEAAGDATVTATFEGNYTGSAHATFTLTEYGQANVIAQQLDEQYRNQLTGTLYNVPLLEVEFDEVDENIHVTWTSSSTALNINEHGVVTINHPEIADEEVTLTCTVNYSTTSTAVLNYQFVIPAKVSVNVPEGYKFTSTENNSGDYGLADGEVLLTAYDITVTDNAGNKVNDHGTVTVKILIPEEYRSLTTLTVYHIVGETKTAVSAQRVGDYLVFNADSFSPYVIAYTVPETAKSEGDIYAMLKAGKNVITLGSDITVDTLLIDGYIVTLNLGEYTITADDADKDESCYGVYAINGAVVTINATTGGIYTKSAGWNIPLRASKGSTINVNGGTYYAEVNNSEDTENNGTSGMYASDTSVINLYNGTFETAGKYYGFYYLLNIQEKSDAQINVYGGTYVNADPRRANTGANLVQEGLVVETRTEGGKTYYDVVKETYTVTFLGANGEVLKTEEVAVGQAATAPEDPTKPGHDFAGWDKAFNNVISDLTISPTWEVQEYKVVFKDGEEVLDTQEVEHGQSAEAPELPTQEGYTSSWDKEFNNITSDLVVNVVYTVNTYTVTFVSEEETVKTETVEYGKAATAPELEKEGYSLTWNVEFDNVKSNLTVTAIWTINTYTVTFKNGDEQLAAETVEYGKAATAPQLPLKSGYNASWDKAFDNVKSNLVVNVEYNEVEEISIAEFLALDVNSNVYYKLTGTISNVANTTYGNFDLTDGTGTIYVYGLTATQVAKNDKTFASLGIGAEYVVTLIGTRAEHNGNPQVGGPAYYVSHVAPTYTVTVTIEGNGDATVDNESVTGGSTVKLTVTPDSGYKVSSIKANNSVVALEEGNIYEIEINANTEITVVFVEESQEVVETLSATITFDDTTKRTNFSTEQQVWEENGITVTNDKAGSTTNVGDYAKPLRMYKNSTLTVAINGNIQAIIFDCTGLESKYVDPISGLDGAKKDGNTIRFELNGENTYTFAPFSAQARVNSITVEYTASNTPTYTVTFDSNEGSAVSSEQVVEGGKITEPSDPTKEGYTFDGWYLEDTYENKYDFNKPVTEDLTLYAKWEVKSENPEQDGNDEPKWTLVTDISQLSAGKQVVIVANGSNVALSTTQNDNNRGQANVNKDGDITFGSDVQILTLEDGKNAGTFAFNTGSGYLYAASSSKNYLRTETNLSANSSWAITITDAGVATIKAQGSNSRNLLRYNSSSKIFACYSSGQLDVCIYVYE